MDRGKGWTCSCGPPRCAGGFPARPFRRLRGEVEGHEAVAREAERRARELGLADAVSFTGWLRAGRHAGKHAALNVLASASTLPESSACADRRLARVSPSWRPTTAGPARFASRRDGLLVPARRPAPDGRRESSNCCATRRGPTRWAGPAARAEQNFDARQHARDLQLLYEEVLKRRS